MQRLLRFDVGVNRLAAAFGVLALMIAAVGIYGLLSYEVAKRANEIGIRMALGARRSIILGMVAGEIALLCAAGVVLGSLAALAAGKLVARLVFGIEPNSPVVLSVAAMILVGTAVAAALFPARRAASIDPMLALRQDW